ncbi:MAG: site-specific DNA-methyltransferase, partial [Gammaproteobacteria bacterium]|nr:site-specific DNA-methyltransferase [Gammaproteobacteria bacterium]
MSCRVELEKRFGGRLSVDPQLGRQIVSYQGNKGLPGLRWMKYKEGFSKALVERFLEEKSPSDLLDPFSGLGTAPLVASGQGVNATGIEIMPVGVLAATGISHAANGLDKKEFHAMRTDLLRWVSCRKKAGLSYRFPHVGITEKAFPEKTEQDIAKAREFIEQIEDSPMRDMLNLACMSILESVSFTRKDGQYLRWDYRSGRALRSHVDLGEIQDFTDALENRLREMEDDIEEVKDTFGNRYPQLLSGSCLELLRGLPDASVDLIVTSPPYANRYDYT